MKLTTPATASEPYTDDAPSVSTSMRSTMFAGMSFGLPREITVAVDQHQRARRTEAAQADRREPRAAAVVDLRVDVRAGDRRQLLHEIAERQLAGLLDRGAIDRDDRIGRFDVDATDVRTRHGDRFELLIALVLRRLAQEQAQRSRPPPMHPRTARSARL